MKSRYADNWSFQFSETGPAANAAPYIMFSCPSIAMNIVHTFQGVIDILEGEEPSLVPVAVMQEALGMHEVEAKRA